MARQARVLPGERARPLDLEAFAQPSQECHQRLLALRQEKNSKMDQTVFEWRE